MRFLGIIPARGGSKSIPWKNIVELKGKPLISYTIEAALTSKLDKVIVSTDAEKIAKVARDYNAIVMRRPDELARDDTPTLPVLQHVVESLDENFNFLVTLQPTSPFRTAKHINEALELLINNPTADTLVSVIEIPHKLVPSSLMKLDNGFLKQYINQEEIILRRQDKPKLYARNGPAILIMNIKNLLSGKLYNSKIVPYFMNSINSVDIDNNEDLLIAEHLFDLWSVTD